MDDLEILHNDNETSHLKGGSSKADEERNHR